MRRALSLVLPFAIVVLARPAHAQPAPLPTLPPPAPGAAPSTLNPNAPSPSTAPPTANATPSPTPTPNPNANPNPNTNANPNPNANANPPPMDVTSSPPTVTQVSAPYVPAEPPPPAPISCAGPGAFTHDGFYLRLSSGIGGLAVGGSGPGSSPKLSGFASSTMLAIGGTPSRGFAVGGAIAARSVASPQTSSFPGDVTGVQASQLGVFVDWFPNEQRGWHVGGLLGIGTLRIQAVQGDEVNLSFAGQAFGGYDFWIGPEWSLGIQGVLGFSTQSPLMDANRNDSGYSLGSLSGAIEGTLLFH